MRQHQGYAKPWHATLIKATQLLVNAISSLLKHCPTSHFFADQIWRILLPFCSLAPPRPSLSHVCRFIFARRLNNKGLSSSLASPFGAHIPLLADHYGPAEIVFVSSSLASLSPGPLTMSPGAISGATATTHRPRRHQMVCIQTRRCFSRHRRDRSPRAHDAHAHSPARLPPGEN